MDAYKVEPGQKIDLKKADPTYDTIFKGDKKEGKKQLRSLNIELETMQEMLYAEDKHKLLVILQGTDTSGKDGVIRHVFEGVNPQGVSVASFKVPTDEELSHDYLWRVHKQVPGDTFHGFQHILIVYPLHPKRLYQFFPKALVPETIFHFL